MVSILLLKECQNGWVYDPDGVGCIVTISVFDWGCVSFSKGWGSIQEWVSIDADTVVI